MSGQSGEGLGGGLNCVCRKSGSNCCGRIPSHSKTDRNRGRTAVTPIDRPRRVGRFYVPTMAERVRNPWLELHLTLRRRRRIRVRKRYGILEKEGDRQVRNSAINCASSWSHFPRMLSRRWISSSRKHESRTDAPAKSGLLCIAPVRDE